MGAHYAASKAGIVIVTKLFAAELAADGVTVNAIAPAAVRTPAFDVLPPERLEALRERIPVGRFGEPEEVAELVAYLCSDAGGYVTGATLDVNGGLLMR
jgi:3-oxoacyl-[acyl-carrier protein] reductase